MICEKQVKKYCRDDLSLIENYYKAIADTAQTWVCHHRDEVKVLPSGMIAIRSIQDLIDAGRYFSCPAYELIFLTKSEHTMLHNKTRTGELNGYYGKTHSDEARKKMSEAKKGKSRAPFSEEHRKKLSDACKGKAFSDEHRKKLSKAKKGKHWKLVDGKRVWF